MMTSEVAYITTKEAAELLGISLRSAQLWVENGALLAWKTSGGHRRILLISVQKIIEERNKLSFNPAQNLQNNLKIAIVEDDLDLLELVLASIGSFSPNAQIQTAIDGFKGLIMIGEFKPDILIADLNMPNMDGFRMIRAIEGSEDAPKKIIIMTALSQADIDERGGLPAAATLLQKPFSLDRLELLISAA